MQRPDKIARKQRGKELIRKDPDLRNWQIAERMGVNPPVVADWRAEVAKEEKEKQREVEEGFVQRHKTMKVRFV